MPPEPLGPPPLWRWVLWFAALTGLAQVLVIFALRLATNRFINISVDAVWMVPVANAALFGVAAVVLHVTTFRLRRSTATGMAWATLCFLGGIGPALLFPRLHPAAAILLVAGVAVQSARLVRARAAWVDGRIRWSLPALLVVGAAIGVGQFGSREVTARRAEASLPSPAAGAPNVILIVLDTVRATGLSLYGYERLTSPHLDAFARSGVTFDHALSASSWTLPSHASMFTGMLPHEIAAGWLAPLGRTHQTLAEALAARGYATVGVVANLRYATSATGLSRGFLRYYDFPRSVRTVALQSWLVRPLFDGARDTMADPENWVRKHAAAVTAEFSDWLDSRPANRPFFAFLNYYDSHFPYLAPAPFDAQFGDGGPLPDVLRRRSWSPQEVQRSRDAYDGTIAYLDQEVARLIDGLRSRHLLDNTLIVITSDHGEQFGAHGLFEHSSSLYRAEIEVPLVFSFPSRIPAGVRVLQPVSLVDLPATILDVVRTTDAVAFPGRTLAGLWNRSAPAPGRTAPLLSDLGKGINKPAWARNSTGNVQSVVLDGVHYIRNGDGTEELFDFEHDVAEIHNLIDRPDMQTKLAAARRAVTWRR